MMLFLLAPTLLRGSVDAEVPFLRGAQEREVRLSIHPSVCIIIRNLQFLPRFGIILGHGSLHPKDVHCEGTSDAHEN